MPPQLRKRWTLEEPISPEADQALSSFPPFFRQILFNRGVKNLDEAYSYLNGLVPPGSDDPFQLVGMDATVERLLWAVKHGEQIAVYGDYDVDGVTATALLTQVLRQYGAQVSPYIPNRFDEGYGLNLDALDTLQAQGVRVIVTVDCGIRSPVEAKRAEELGIDLIISDHHHPASELPDAFAVICPKQEGDGYPYKELSGVGLAYKIAQALGMRSPENGVAAEDWLDLVALGTVADVVPLTGENRGIVRRGLALMRARGSQNRVGLYSLANVAGVKVPRVSAGDIGFILGPRLNAAGRMDTATAALNLLLSEDLSEAGLLSQNLDNQNRDRQELTRRTQEEAIQRMEPGSADHILFAFDEHYNSGIVGLVASRLVDAFYRPAVVGSIDGEYTRASCRSIPEFHITRALDDCRDLLVRHGGHALAAGFTVHNDNLPELTRRLREISGQQLGNRELRPALRIDCEIPLARMRPDYVETIIRYLDQLQPTGQGNPEAVFVSRDLEVSRVWAVGADKNHLRMTVKAGNVTFDGIAFRQGSRAAEAAGRIDLVYGLELNEYNGRTSLQLNIRDFKPSGTSD